MGAGCTKCGNGADVATNNNNQNLFQETGRGNNSTDKNKNPLLSPQEQVPQQRLTDDQSSQSSSPLVLSAAEVPKPPTPPVGNQTIPIVSASPVATHDSLNNGLNQRRLELGDGSVYEGDVVTAAAAKNNTNNNGKHASSSAVIELTGKGKLTYASGDVYEGRFRNGMRHGDECVFRSADDSVEYIGPYRNNKKDGGVGILRVDNCVYVGHFADDEMHDARGFNLNMADAGGDENGQSCARYVFEDGSVYEGPFVHGAMTTPPAPARATTTLMTTSLTPSTLVGRLTTVDPADKSIVTSHYVGEFLDGERHGVGEERYASGAVLSGEFVKGAIKAGTRATYRFPPPPPGLFLEDGEAETTSDIDKAASESDLATETAVNNNSTNNGSERSAAAARRGKKEKRRKRRECDIYIGLFNKDGAFEDPRGELYRVDGSEYKGSFIDGAMCGRGVYTFPSGDVYEGEMKDNGINGQGVLTRFDRTAVSGAYGSRDGPRGSIMWRPSSRNASLTGSDQQRRGSSASGLGGGDGVGGEIISPVHGFSNSDNQKLRTAVIDGSSSAGSAKPFGTIVYKGTFKDGILQGVGTCKFPNGDFYEGTFNDKQQFHGKGTLMRYDGSQYRGDFENGFMCGVGVYSFPRNSGTYEGQIANHRFNGKGTLTTIRQVSNTSITTAITGMWVDGKQEGDFEVETVSQTVRSDSTVLAPVTKFERRVFKGGVVVK